MILNKLTLEDQALMTCIICGLILYTGLFLEHIVGLEPCPLCLVQRFWFFSCGVLAYTSLMHNPRYGIYPLLTICAALVGACYAIWHILLQFNLSQAISCSPPMEYLASSTDQLLKVLWDTFKGNVGCNTRYWLIPIPAWALAGFLLIAGNAAAQLKRIAVTA